MDPTSVRAGVAVAVAGVVSGALVGDGDRDMSRVGWEGCRGWVAFGWSLPDAHNLLKTDNRGLSTSVVVELTCIQVT